MTRLSFFVACKDVYWNEATEALTLIEIFSGFRLNPSDYEGDMLTPTTLVPVAWSVAGAWEKDPDDPDDFFEQRIEIVGPGGNVEGEASEPYELVRRTGSFHMQSGAFPSSPPGLYKVLMSTRRSESENWVVVGSLILELTYETKLPAGRVVHTQNAPTLATENTLSNAV